VADNPWMQRRVFNWPHRGGGREQPSNTLRAMRHGLAVGGHGVELDVHLTADGEVVVAHDDELGKMTERPGRIRSSALDELRRRNAGWNWTPGEISSTDPRAPHPCRDEVPAPDDLRIPTLREVLEDPELAGRPINIELKSLKAARPLAEILEATGRTDVIVCAIPDWRLWWFRRHSRLPTSPGGLALLAYVVVGTLLGVGLPYRRTAAIQPPLRLGRVRVCTKRLVRAAHRTGHAVHVWTVDDPDDIRLAVELGVDGIMSDRPSTLAHVLAEHGVAWDGAT
jgi:glycerophosphoryl diester phosphodiesterase